MSRRHAGAQGGRLHVVVDEPRQRDEEADLIPLTWPGILLTSMLFFAVAGLMEALRAPR